MFDPILNLSADVYEVIIAALLAVGGFQIAALRRKTRGLRKMKAAAIELGVVACRAIVDITNAALKAVIEYKEIAEDALSDAAEAEAEMDDWRRKAMEAAADDDGSDPISQMLFGRVLLRKSNLEMLDIDGGPSVRVVRVPRGLDPLDAIMADIAASLAKAPRPPDGAEADEGGLDGRPEYRQPHFPTSPRAG